MNSSYNDELRNKCSLLLNKELNNTKISRIIEQNIFNHIINYSKTNNIKRLWINNIFRNLYISKIRSIYTNLKKDSYIKNIDFKKRILSGDINYKDIAKLTAFDIFPENWKELIDLKTKRDKLKYELKPEAMTDMFKCRKCSSRSCSYYEMQTRSADEPMTQFISCLDCGNHWRQ